MCCEAGSQRDLEIFGSDAGRMDRVLDGNGEVGGREELEDVLGQLGGRVVQREEALQDPEPDHETSRLALNLDHAQEVTHEGDVLSIDAFDLLDDATVLDEDRNQLVDGASGLGILLLEVIAELGDAFKNLDRHRWSKRLLFRQMKKSFRGGRHSSPGIVLVHGDEKVDQQGD